MEREYDCEYTDGPIPSATQLLERDVVRLEARIKELEADPQRTSQKPTAAALMSTAPNVQDTPSSSTSVTSSQTIIPVDPESEVHQAVIGLLRIVPQLPTQQDQITRRIGEEGERINAFWTTYILDRGWSVAQGSHANDVFLGVQIDTPWPQEMGSYEEGSLPSELRSFNTVNTFLQDPAAETPYNAISTIAFRAKAATLFERATRLASQWTHGLQPLLELPLQEADPAAPLPPAMSEFDGFYVQVYQLDAVLRSFTAGLLSLDTPEVAGNVELGAYLLVTHTYAQCALIRLHTHLEFSLTTTDERQDLRAAKEAADAISKVQLTEMPILDPILAILWSVVGRVFIDSIKRLGNDEVEPKNTLLLYLDKVLGAMSLYSHTSVLMSSQVAALQTDLLTLNVPHPFIVMADE
ncbi:hypothetical protein EUX98_g7276 [Antrodiella citrinella]|uniref:Uncharacterized protein n=1 Tax=Antrodiella citrinella TaxID=2447956 RepID=A0A4S4MLY6_9APHY|nr:hypothetical protein EUX98_g7276 [Antrodiella citrinella]